MPRTAAEDLVEALKLVRRGQVIAHAIWLEHGLSARIYGLVKDHIKECQKVLDKYPNLK